MKKAFVCFAVVLSLSLYCLETYAQDADIYQYKRVVPFRSENQQAIGLSTAATQKEFKMRKEGIGVPQIFEFSGPTTFTGDVTNNFQARTISTITGSSNVKVVQDGGDGDQNVARGNIATWKRTPPSRCGGTCGQ